jgi:hypothetical protein
MLEKQHRQYDEARARIFDAYNRTSEFTAQVPASDATLALQVKLQATRDQMLAILEGVAIVLTGRDNH